MFPKSQIGEKSYTYRFIQGFTFTSLIHNKDVVCNLSQKVTIEEAVILTLLC